MENETQNIQPLMRFSDSVKNIFSALAKFQSDVPNIPRSKTVKVRTKKGGNYSFSYAPLPDLLQALRKPLAEQGLALSQVFDDGSLITILVHESGEFLESRMAIKLEHSNPQDTGEVITYKRRYSIESILGISASDDNDANNVAGNTVERKSSGSSSSKPKTNSTGATLPEGKKSGDLNATEVAKLIRDVPNEELEGFLSPDEERVTVLKVWESKVGDLPDYLGSDEEPPFDSDDEEETEKDEPKSNGKAKSKSMPDFDADEFDTIKELVSTYNEYKDIEGFKELHFDSVQRRMRELH